MPEVIASGQGNGGRERLSGGSGEVSWGPDLSTSLDSGDRCGFKNPFIGSESKPSTFNLYRNNFIFKSFVLKSMVARMESF